MCNQVDFDFRTLESIVHGYMSACGISTLILTNPHHLSKPNHFSPHHATNSHHLHKPDHLCPRHATSPHHLTSPHDHSLATLYRAFLWDDSLQMSFHHIASPHHLIIASSHRIISSSHHLTIALAHLIISSSHHRII